MAWNPEPEVAAARDYGKKFNCDMVLIVGIREGEMEVTTYGKTKVECGAARVLGKVAFDAVHKHLTDALMRSA